MGKKYGENFVLDSNKTTGTDFESVDLAVFTIFVRKDGSTGAVIVGTFDNVVTGPKQRTGYIIIILKSGKSCMFYGTLSIQYFCLRR